MATRETKASKNTRLDAAKTYLAIDPEDLAKVAPKLEIVLANTMYMYSLYKKYHWHVAGADFYEYHLMFDKHATEILAMVDLLAERIRTIGGHADLMPADVARLATVKEADGVGHKPQDMVASLLSAHEEYLEQVHEAAEEADDADDEGTEDLLTSQVLRVHELQVWFLRSSLD